MFNARPGSVAVLLYHDISRDRTQAEALSNPDYTTPLPKLEYHLKWILNSGYHPLRLEEWIGVQRRGEKLPGNHLLLTFDGPHKGWFEYLLPVLERYAFPATFFITAGWVGADHPYPESEDLSWEDINRLTKVQDGDGRQLFDLGCHSLTHSILEQGSEEGQKGYRQRLREEIILPARVMRKHTDSPVLSFALPKGRGRPNELHPYFQQAGYQAVRWARLPGSINRMDKNLYDLQILYCDTLEQPQDKLVDILTREASWFNKALARIKKRIKGR